jgi:hypothetical protein
MILNYYAILIAAVASLVIGSLWYSPFAFGHVWLRLRGKDVREADGMRMPASNMFIEFLCVLVTAYVLAILTTVFGSHTVYATVLLGIIIWVGFYVTTLLSEVVWEEKPFELFLLNAGLRLVTTVVMTVVVGLWQ